MLGKADIPLRNVIHGGTGTLEIDQTLLDADNQPTSGLVKLSITYTPPKGMISFGFKPNFECLLLYKNLKC